MGDNLVPVDDHWFYVPVNPEPWAIGSISVGKRNGKMIPIVSPNIQLKTFKESLKEHFDIRLPVTLPEGKYELEFFFWRNLDRWETSTGRKVSSSKADATNLQKATEDGLQGILFDNDRDVSRITSVIMEQDFDIMPGIAIHFHYWEGPFENELDIPVFILNQRMNQQIDNRLSDNSWPPGG